MPLTAKRVARLRRKPGRHLDERGLLLQVRSPTNASWLFRYELHGKEHMQGLGSADDFTLKEARARAHVLRQQIADGIDPLAAKEAQQAARKAEAAKAKTFEAAATEYFEAHKAKWRSIRGPRQQFLSSLKAYVFPIIGKMPVGTIETPLVLQVMEQKSADGEKLWDAHQSTARRVLRRIEAVLDWATVRKYRTGDNPARWDGYLSEALPTTKKVKPMASLPYKEVPPFMAELRKLKGVAHRALEFTILTAVRRGATYGATWDEIDLEKKLWVIPADTSADRNKANRETIIPLSDRALEILKAAPREQGNPHIFIGEKASGLSKTAMREVIKRMGFEDKTTTHGFRSSFRTWTAEQTTTEHHVAEAAMQHVVKDGVERAYQRGALIDKRRKLMEAWSRYCAGPATGNVIQGDFKKRKRA